MCINKNPLIHTFENATYCTLPKIKFIIHLECGIENLRVRMKRQCKRRRYDKARERNNNWWDSRSWCHQSQTDSVTFGQQSQWVVEIRAIDAVEARLVGASDDARLLAIDADEIFCTIAKVTADQIIARRVVLTRIRFAFVDILITSERTSQKVKKNYFRTFSVGETYSHLVHPVWQQM